MGKETEISWSDATFNLVWGCTKVSEACRSCYAEAFSHRLGKDLWGKDKERQTMSESYWKQPLKLDKQAQKAGVRKRVFCSSMADVFEDHETVNAERVKLFALIDQTPNLDWLLLTKRPENIRRLWPFGWYDDRFTWPNVWLGVTAENQEWADKRIPYLLDVPAKVRFLSCEPLLGAIDLNATPAPQGTIPLNGATLESLQGCLPKWQAYPHRAKLRNGIDWVICGGESGHGARPMHPDWARSLRDQCIDAGVAYHFKQWGNWLPYEPYGSFEWRDQTGVDHDGNCLQILDPETGDAAKGWNDGLDFIGCNVGQAAFKNVGKHAAGRLLDGREWNQMPA